MSNIQKIDSQLPEFVKFIQNKGNITPFAEDIYLITVNVAGLIYAEDINEIFPKIKKGDYLELFRESNNQYDKLAIVVKYGGEKIGYVPQKHNAVLANLMDAGKEIYGVVEAAEDDCIYDGYDFKAVEFKIYLKE